MPDNQHSGGSIDLHSHTTESDGSYSPEELIAHAIRQNLHALAITDHDTFSGYELAIPAAKAAGLDLVRGIELNSRLDLQGGGDTRAAHILAYFPTQEPSPEFHRWLQSERDERRERNRRLANALQRQGVDITLEEVEARGRTLAGRTHFAQILLEIGYVATFEEAFERYLGRGASTYVERESPSTRDTICRIREAGGIPTVAHPIRLNLPQDIERVELRLLADQGLMALEVIHSDQSPELQAYYRALAADFNLLPTGGSDFHGLIKPFIELGRGVASNVQVPIEFLQGLREAPVPTHC